jgi:hypothetical protein
MCSADVRVLDTVKMEWNLLEVVYGAGTAEAEAKGGGAAAAGGERKAAGSAGAAAAAAKSDYTGMSRGGASCPRSECTATVVGRKVYVIGGWTSSNPQLNQVDVK